MFNGTNREDTSVYFNTPGSSDSKISPFKYVFSSMTSTLGIALWGSIFVSIFNLVAFWENNLNFVVSPLACDYPEADLETHSASNLLCKYPLRRRFY